MKKKMFKKNVHDTLQVGAYLVLVHSEAHMYVQY
jgi:hypothetical protein